MSIADAQAKVFGDALKSADMTIVGGQEAFFESFSKALTVGKMVEGVLDTSPTARNLVNSAIHGLGRRQDDLQGVSANKSANKDASSRQKDADTGLIDPKMVADLTPGE